MVYEGGDWSLRIRLRPGAGGGLERVRSWTGSFEPGFESLSSACRALGIRPASPAPEDYLDEPTVQRRALPDPRSGAQHTLTARWRGGRLRSLTAFDEPPDWRGEGEAR